MKILRSVNRRGFHIASAGFFTVLQPNTWFAASRMPSLSAIGRVRGAGLAGLPEQNVSGNAANAPQIMRLDDPDRNWLRPALVVSMAVACAAFLLWVSFDSPKLW
jgi:hypothetical protein